MPSAFYHVTGSESSWEDKTRDEAEPEDLPGFVRYLHLANDRTAFFFMLILPACTLQAGILYLAEFSRQAGRAGNQENRHICLENGEIFVQKHQKE